MILSSYIRNCCSRRVMSKAWKVLLDLLLGVPNVMNHTEASGRIAPHRRFYSLWFVLMCVSERWLCASRFCPARLQPIDSRWDLSIKHPEQCSLPNPGMIQSHPLHAHAHTLIQTHPHLTCHPSIPPSGPLLIPLSHIFAPYRKAPGPKLSLRRFNFWQIYNKARVII